MSIQDQQYTPHDVPRTHHDLADDHDEAPGMPATVGAAIRWASGCLERAGVASPRVDAEILAAHVLGCDKSELFFRAQDPITEDFAELVSLRASRKPVQYITGIAPVGGLDFHVGPGVFIPRPETELVIEWALDHLESYRAPLVVDLCAGSGTLAVSIAHARPDARVIAVEKDTQAIRWLRQNIADYAPTTELVVADVCDRQVLADLHGTVDMVVSNPPYVPQHSPVPPEVHYDPAVAVFGGADGMSVITPMTHMISALLRPGGAVAIEHDDSTGLAVTQALLAVGLTRAKTHVDFAGRDRFVTAYKAE